MRREAAAFPSLRILGPNCLGYISPGRRLNVSFAAAMPRLGDVAFISQSGALGTSVLDWAAQERLGFSHFVSLGNALDVGFAELIDYFGEDEGTRAILLYIESIRNARRFMTAARAFARTKPIIVYKSGRYPESAAGGGFPYRRPGLRGRRLRRGLPPGRHGPRGGHRRRLRLRPSCWPGPSRRAATGWRS